MEDDFLKFKREESLKNIQEAFLLAKGDSSNELNLSDIVNNIQSDAFEKETVFGFNVRLKSDDVIIPLLGGEIWKARSFDFDDFNDLMDPKLTIPEIFKELKERAIEFTLNDDNTVEDFCADNEFKNREDKCFYNVIDSLENEKSFAVAQKNFLFPKEKKVHFWISRECDDLTNRGTTHYLSNILIITTQKDHIEFVKKNRLDFLRFLFKMEIAYAAILEKSRKKEAIKSAVSAIMSRNMSHNLGSHYLYYTKSYLEQKAAEDRDISPDIRGVAKVLGYLQSRMDFLATIISNDKYSYGPVNFKSQIFDELTVDDFSHRHFPEETNKRTTNFLLTNLIRSENFTRDDVKTDDENLQHENRLFLKVKCSKDGVKYRDFTGSWHEQKMLQEQKIKNDLSRLNLALPGGIMSSHAFFTVLENFIRNSAKYLRKDIRKSEGLVFTIVIKPHSEKTIEKNKQKKDETKFLDIIFYDNKRNANKYIDDGSCKTLFLDLCERLGKLEIIDKSNILANEDKGLKEMLLSTIWMRSYNFQENESYSDILTRINNEEDPKEKLGLIEKYGFTLVKVVERGKTKLNVYEEEPYDGEANLGVLFTLPIYKTIESLEMTDDPLTNEDKMFRVMADVVEVKKTKQLINHRLPDLRRVFTRVIPYSRKESDLEKYKRSIRNRFDDVDKYAICFMRDGEPPLCEPLYKSYLEEGVMGDNSNIQYRIYFKYHLDSKQNPGKKNKGLAYVDTISGGNFTITLEELFKNAVKNGFNRDNHFKEEADELLALKIKESALTRITIIDERLFKTTKMKKNALEWLSLKNIRLLNFDENSDSTLGTDEPVFSRVFMGNSFNNLSNETHFLTVHLGLIEKILKNSRIVNAEINKRLNIDKDLMPENKLSKDRIEAFMGMLKEYFGEDAYIAVHSGRGNSLSKDVKEALDSYPFVSLSALEIAFNNSKFQLSQLLYNTIYMRKKS